MIGDVKAFTDQLRLQAASGDLDGALVKISEFVLGVIACDSSIARVFSSRELDRLCLDLGRLTGTGSPGGEVDQGRSVFLVSGVYPTGGHTRVLLDLIKADGADDVTVLVTNTYQQLTEESLAQILSPAHVSFELAPDENPAGRLRWVQERLAALRPARTYILQHHFDPLCPAAVQPELVDQLFFFHNGDHSLTLGVHIPHAVHIDFNAKGFYHCREVEGVEGNIVWPLSVDDPGIRSAGFDVHELTTCCCGGYEKFELPHLAEAIPYAVRYDDMVATILSATGGRHIHIGSLSPELLEGIGVALDRRAIPRSRFVHLTYAPELTKALLDYGVDVFVGSAPRGGGRAMVEALAVGLPMLVHSNYRTIFFSAENDIYEGAMVWRDLYELEAHLASLTVERLEWHSWAARAFYEANHHPDRLKAAVAATLSKALQQPPPRPKYRGDALQAYLDERQVVSSGPAQPTVPEPPPPSEPEPPPNMPPVAQKVWRVSTAELAWALVWRFANKFRSLRIPRPSGQTSVVGAGE